MAEHYHGERTNQVGKKPKPDKPKKRGKRTGGLGFKPPQEQPCHACNGTGMIGKKMCARCMGSGTI